MRQIIIFLMMLLMASNVNAIYNYYTDFDNYSGIHLYGDDTVVDNVSNGMLRLNNVSAAVTLPNPTRVIYNITQNSGISNLENYTINFRMTCQDTDGGSTVNVVNGLDQNSSSMSYPAGYIWEVRSGGDCYIGKNGFNEVFLTEQTDQLFNVTVYQNYTESNLPSFYVWVNSTFKGNFSTEYLTPFIGFGHEDTVQSNVDYLYICQSNTPDFLCYNALNPVNETEPEAPAAASQSSIFMEFVIALASAGFFILFIVAGATHFYKNKK